MKPIRNYSDGQWLVLLWGFIVGFLLVGLLLGSAALVVIALLGGAGAGYTTYLYIRQLQPRQRPTSSAADADTHEGGSP